MAESNIAVTAGSGEVVDTFTLTNSNKRQAVVVGDSSIPGNVAPVQATDPTSATQGIVVRDVNTSAIVASLASTLGVYLASTAGTINVQLKPGTIAVQFDPGHTLGTVISNVGTGTMAVFFDQSAPTVKAIPSTGTFTVQFDPGHELGTIKGNSNTLTVFLPDTGHTLGKVDAGAGTFNVQLDPGHTIGNIASVGSITNTVAVFFSPANPSVNAAFSGSIGVFFSPSNPSVNATFTATSLEVVPSTGSRNITDAPNSAMRVLIAGSQTNASLTINGTVTANAGTGTMTVQFDPGHTLGALTSVNSITTTVTVKLDPGTTLGKVDQGVGGTSAWLANIGATASIFTASGTASGVSLSGNTIISPSANASFKIYAYSIQTTGQVSIAAKFTNGAASGPTEFWRPLITASGVTGAQGANLATQPGAPIFITGTSTTLALLLDSATLVHYSVAYTKESA